MKIPDAMGELTNDIGVDEREAKGAPEQRTWVDGEGMEVEVVDDEGGEVLWLSDMLCVFLGRNGTNLREWRKGLQLQ